MDEIALPTYSANNNVVSLEDCNKLLINSGKAVVCSKTNQMKAGVIVSCPQPINCKQCILYDDNVHLISNKIKKVNIQKLKEIDNE
jgi:hypothetical protein